MTPDERTLFDTNIAEIAATRSKLAARFINAKEKNPLIDVSEQMAWLEKIAHFETLLYWLVTEWAKAKAEAEEAAKWNNRAAGAMRFQEQEIEKLKKVIAEIN